LAESLTETESEKKAKRNEEIAKATDELKDRAQDLLNGDITISEFVKALNELEQRIPEKSGSFSTFASTTLKNLDTQKYNEYINGGKLEDLKLWVSERKKSGAGGIDYLNSLYEKAQTNEDNVKYNAYIKGESTFEEFLKYANGRIKSGASADRVGTLVAQAKTNENKIQDSNKATLYNAGLLNGEDYLKYLNDRIASEPNATVQVTLKTSAKTVMDNEWTKKLNDVVSRQQAGQISVGQAVNEISTLLSQTNDAKLQQAALAHIDAYRKQSERAAGEVTAALNQRQTAAKSLYDEARLRYEDEETDLKTALATARPDSIGGIIARMIINDRTYLAAVNSSKDYSPFQQWMDLMDGEAAKIISSQQQRRWSAYAVTAQNLVAEGSKSTKGNPYKGYADAVDFWGNVVTKSPVLTPEQQKAAYAKSIDLYNEARTAFNESDEGVRWNILVSDILTQLKSGGIETLKFLAKNTDIPLEFDYNGNVLGVEQNQEKFRNWLEQKLASGSSDVIRRALVAGNVRGYATMSEAVPVLGPDGKPMSGAYGADKTTTLTTKGMSERDWADYVLNSGVSAFRGIKDAQITSALAISRYDPKHADPLGAGETNAGPPGIIKYTPEPEPDYSKAKYQNSSGASQPKVAAPFDAAHPTDFEYSAQPKPDPRFATPSTVGRLGAGGNTMANANAGASQFDIMSLFGQPTTVAPQPGPAPVVMGNFNATEALAALSGFHQSEHSGSAENPVAAITPLATGSPGNAAPVVSPVSVTPYDPFAEGGSFIPPIDYSAPPSFGGGSVSGASTDTNISEY